MSSPHAFGKLCAIAAFGVLSMSAHPANQRRVVGNNRPCPPNPPNPGPNSRPTSSSWTEALLLLLRDLYALNADNKVFLSSRFLAASPDEMAAPYRRIVRQVCDPDRGMPSLQLGAARKALNDFKKVCAEPRLVIDFMLFYVEQGTICTNSYGDISGPFYESLLSVFHSAAELTSQVGDLIVIEQFRPCFEKLIEDTGNIGWGFHDGMVDIYWTFLPPSAEETV